MPKDSEGSTGSSYIVDRKNRKVLIPIDVNKIGDVKELLGTLTEEVAHGKDALEGRQDKKVAEDKSNDEEGLESLGRPANEYVKKKFGEDNNSKIKLTTDRIDLSNADVGEKVGDVNTQDDKNSGYAETLPSQQRDPWLNKMNFKLLRLRKNTDEFLEKTLISSFYLHMRAYSIFSDSGETIRDFTLGALKAGGEDLSLNTYKIPKRFQYNTLAYKNGELFGHSTMSAIGILGTIIGSGMEGGGTAAAPATGGFSLEVAAIGAGGKTYAAGVGATAASKIPKTILEIKAMKSEGGSSESNSTEISDDSINKTQSEKATLHEGKQGKHVVGHNNFQQGKGEVDMQTASNILNDFQGIGQKIERDGKIVKEIVDTQGKYNGIFIDKDTGQRSITSRFTIHYDSKGTAHIVPANPNPK